MQHIAAGEDTGDVRLEGLVDDRAGRHRRKGDAAHLGELILRDQSAGQEQCVAGVCLFRSGDRLSVRADLGDHYGFHTLLADDVDDSVAELQRNVKVVQALDDISLQAAGIRHQFRDYLDLRAFERHAARHDQSDVAGAEDHDFAAGHSALQIHEALRRARGVDARRAVSGDVQRSSRPLAAAHREDDCLRADLQDAVSAVHRGDDLVPVRLRRDIEDHRSKKIRDLQLFHLLNEPGRVLRAGQFFLEGVKAEPVVDALVQDPAQGFRALKNQDVLLPALICAHRS